MAAPKGHVKYGGRTRGTPNRKTQNLFDKAHELNVNPFEILLLFAKGDWKSLGYDDGQRLKMVTEGGQHVYEDVITAELRATSAKEACQYLYPKRRAIEVSADIDPKLLDEAQELNDLSEEELIAITKEELLKLKPRK